MWNFRVVIILTNLINLRHYPESLMLAIMIRSSQCYPWHILYCVKLQKPLYHNKISDGRSSWTLPTTVREFRKEKKREQIIHIIIIGRYSFRHNIIICVPFLYMTYYCKVFTRYGRVQSSGRHYRDCVYDKKKKK